MPINVAVGMQWGDEGKGRAVDLLSENVDIVARFNGGDNAGHTVTVGDKIFKLHVIPSGIIHKHTIGVLGNGLVLYPGTLLQEMKTLQEAGIEITPKRLWISDAAHLITPAHRLLDQAQEAALGKSSIGTTGRGIGPAYMDKSSRRGLRTGDLLQPEEFKKKVRQHFTEANEMLTVYYHQPAIDIHTMTDEFTALAKELKPFIKPVGNLVRAALKSGKNILAEAAQGTLLDLDQGTYPFVTSSCTTAAGIFSGLGIGIQPVDHVIGITKAFQTRVGSGPFPTELFDATATFLRGSGSNPWDEFGTTTGRPRRVGWVDLVLLKYAIDVNGVTELFLTKMDILSGLDTIKYCAAYKKDGKTINELDFSGSAVEMERCLPVYESTPGWKDDLRSIREWSKLPQAVHNYIKIIEDCCGVPVTQVSVGSERNAVIKR
ncbi:MAG: adenylosuccinate synthase [Chloroflexi bacterium HGW-Chloroflexi-4]|jgi:adenylosuccinate synthase|nr:MAG: adenylosuccinate synthase [Chloroflexi bacterium HGW-Chloroflexi-4]